MRPGSRTARSPPTRFPRALVGPALDHLNGRGVGASTDRAAVVPVGDRSEPQPDSAITPETPRTAIVRTLMEGIMAIGGTWSNSIRSALHPRPAHRVVRCTTALGGAAGVEDLEAIVLLVQGGMWEWPKTTASASGKRASQALQAALGGAARRESHPGLRPPAPERSTSGSSRRSSALSTLPWTAATGPSSRTSASTD